MKHFYIIVNEDKEDTKAMGARITRYLEDHGCTFRTSKGVFSKGKRFTSVSDVPEDTECVITLGGDGTFIQAARDLAGTGLPIVGIIWVRYPRWERGATWRSFWMPCFQTVMRSRNG